MNKPRIKTIVVAVTIAVAGVFAAISADRMEYPEIPSDFESSIGKDIRKKLSKKEYEALKLMMTSLIISVNNNLNVELEETKRELEWAKIQIELLETELEMYKGLQRFDEEMRSIDE